MHSTARADFKLNIPKDCEGKRYQRTGDWRIAGQNVVRPLFSSAPGVCEPCVEHRPGRDSHAAADIRVDFISPVRPSTIWARTTTPRFDLAIRQTMQSERLKCCIQLQDSRAKQHCTLPGFSRVAQAMYSARGLACDRLFDVTMLSP